MVVQLLDGIAIWPCSDIKHKGILWLDILAYCLEEPTMGVDLTIVPLFDTEHEVDAASLQDLLIDAKVPCGHLEAVQNVEWVLFLRHLCVHDIRNVLKLELIVAVGLHEAFLEHDFFVEEALFPS